MKRIKQLLSCLLIFCLTAGMVPLAEAAAGDYTGNRDWLWPVPSSNSLSSCYMDLIGHGYGHYALDIVGEHYAPILAPWDGTVVKVNDQCTQDYPKSGSGYCCGLCSNLGKYVYIQHEYLGTTFISRYGHMSSISVKLGDKVTRGQEVGKIGSTGRSFGYHLDFRIYQGAEATSETKTCVDPLLDQFLELPEGFNANSASSWSTCCYEYAEEVLALYRCPHTQTDGFGACLMEGCSYVYPWESTFSSENAGIYQVSASGDLSPRTDLPYSASENLGTPLIAGEEIEVLGSVTNAFQEVWYQVADGYVPGESLTFLRWSSQEITCQNFVPDRGEVVPKASYRLSGQVSSRYPLTKIIAYLDGEEYASWTAANQTTTQLELSGTNINYQLAFSRLETGKHTIELKGMDIHRTEPETFLTTFFYTEVGCPHTPMDDFGACLLEDCGYVYPWESTYSPQYAGLYQVTAPSGVRPAEVPYSASQNLSALLRFGQEVEVLGSVTNASGTLWYKVATGYVPADSLVSLGQEPQQISCTDFAPAHGEVIPKAPYPLKGTVVSKYPIMIIIAYLDGKEYASWTASNATTTTVDLSTTGINYNLTFGGLSQGKHTIELKGMDIYRSRPETFLITSFYTETGSTEPLTYTLLLNANGGTCDTQSLTVEANTAARLPVPTRGDYTFAGWFTSPTGGTQITDDTPITANMNLYARWTRDLFLTEDVVLDYYPLDRDLYVDLNGHSLSGTILTNGYQIYGMDSATDGYSAENAGVFSCVDENGQPIIPQRHYQTGSGKRYLSIADESGYRFHRFYLAVTHVSLDPSVTGFGYKAVFYGDDAVKSHLSETQAFGFALQLEGRHTVTRYKTREALVSGSPVSLRLRDYDMENFGQTLLSARVTVTLSDGTVIESAQVSTSMRAMLETVSQKAASLSEAQLAAVRAMLENCPVARDWDVKNLCQ